MLPDEEPDPDRGVTAGTGGVVEASRGARRVRGVDVIEVDMELGMRPMRRNVVFVESVESHLLL